MVWHCGSNTQNDIHVIFSTREMRSNTETWAFGSLFWLGTIGRWASHWRGVLQGMLQRHCRPQLSHVLTYFQIHTPSAMHEFLEPGRWCQYNGRKRKRELCEDLASYQKTVSKFPQFSFFILSIDFAQYIIFKTQSLHSVPSSLYLYIKLSLLFLPFPLLSMHRGSWGMQHRKNARSFASLLPLPSPVSLTIRSFYFLSYFAQFSERTFWQWLFQSKSFWKYLMFTKATFIW